MNKKKLIILITILVLVSVFSFYYALKPSKILVDFSDPAYSYLPDSAKIIIENEAKKGNIILTEKNKEPNKAYLNPKYVEYLKLSSEEKSKAEVVPQLYTYDYVSLKSAGSAYPSQFGLDNLTIKNQYSSSICWAFATISSIETNIMVTGLSSEKVLFSERQLDYAMANAITEINNPYSINSMKSKINFSVDNYSLNSASNFISASRYLSMGISPLKEDVWGPFDVNMKSRPISQVLNYDNVDYYVSSYVIYGSNIYNNVNYSQEYKERYLNKLKSHIMNYGSLYMVTISPDYAGSCFDSSAVFLNYDENNPNCASNAYHAMAIVGWDDNYNGGSWILKNSWGTASVASLPLLYMSYYSDFFDVSGVTKVEVKNWDNGYNFTKANTSSYTANAYEITYYKSAEFKENLEKINFTSWGLNSTYKIYYRNGNGAYNLLKSVEVAEPGLTTIDVNNVILDKSSFSIKITASGNGFIEEGINVFTSNVIDERYLETYEFTSQTTSLQKQLLARKVSSGTKLNYFIYDEYGRKYNSDSYSYVVNGTVDINHTLTSLCPPSYSISSDRKSCTRIGRIPSTANTIYSCPDGYSLSNDNQTCTKVVESTVTIDSTLVSTKCEKGYSLSDDKKTCSKRETATFDVEYYCPEGTLSQNYMWCIISNTEKVHSSVRYICPDGYELLPDMYCQKITTIAPIKTYNCPKSYTLSEDNLSCSKVVSNVKTVSSIANTTYSCSEGYKLSNDQTYCSAEYDQEISIPAFQTVRVSYSCSDGVCSTVVLPDYSYCPDTSYKLSGNRCTKVVYKREYEKIDISSTKYYLTLDESLFGVNTDTSIELEVGNTHQIEYEAGQKLNIQTIYYQIDDPSIAEVTENGTIIALKTGSTIVNLNVNDTIVVSIELVVSSNQNAEQLNILEDNQTIYLNLMNELDLHLEVLPSTSNLSNVVWLTSNESIATVNNGKVRFLKEGNVTIFASSGNSLDSISFNVVNSTSSATMTVSKTTIEVGETALLTTLGGDSTYQYEISDEEVVNLENGVVIGLKNGSSWIYYKKDNDVAGVLINVINSEEKMNLVIDPNGGSYDNSKENKIVSENSLTTINLSVPTNNVVVTLVNGENIQNIDVSHTFAGFNLLGYGTLDGLNYTFGFGDARLIANWNKSSYTLPLLEQSDSNFVGWYKDSEFNEFFGKNITFIPEENITLYAKFEEFKTGDINNDNEIDITDLVILRRGLAGLVELTSNENLAADINHDNNVDITDLVILRRYLAGLEEIG